MIAGVDEVGRGPLIGNVVAAAVILPNDSLNEQLADSKQLSEKKRVVLNELICAQAIWSIAEATPIEIDELNIHKATLLAMKRAVDSLAMVPSFVKVDGKFCPPIDIPCEAIIKGDGLISQISAASIIAKVYRDNQMIKLDKTYPEYGFAQHKGYPTKQHLQAIRVHGVLPEHRRSFAPVRALVECV